MADALYFDSGAHRLFGWYHKPPSDKAVTFGVVICKPFGYEAICAHRSIRVFADAVAGFGTPTLRFDYAGTGDSSEIDSEANQLEIWIQNVVAAVSEVQRLSGVQRVYLLGFRLGALIGTLASERCNAVAGLILIAPVLNGRRYARELRTMRLAAAMGMKSSPDTGVMEVSGFLLSAATVRAIADVDLKSARIPSSSSVLVIDSASMPLARAWSEELSRSGTAATYRSLPGMVEMLMTAPQFASVPTEMISAVREWLMQLQDRVVPLPKVIANLGLNKQNSMLKAMPLIPPGSPQEAPVTERAFFLAPEFLLFGIVTEPARVETSDRAIILINAGADYHIGASGIYVSLARRCARNGYVVLRMDLAGLGDSNTRPGGPDNEVFPPGALDDIRLAVQWVRTRYGTRHITLGGICSGAFHSLQAAIYEVQVNRAIMVNPETYFWSEEQSIYDRQTVELVRQPEKYRKKMLSAESWNRLIRGRINLRYVLGTFAGRLALSLESSFRNIARCLRIRLPNDLGWQLEATVARGVGLLFVFSRGEPGLDILKLQGGNSLKRLGERCKIHIIDNADHVFSKLESRVSLEKLLSDELSAPL